MALTECEACKSQNSDTAAKCPKCGAKLAEQSKSKWGSVATEVTALVGALGFGFAIWQYTSTENWKRREFVAAQIKEFYADKVNQAVLTMLDYEPVQIELYPYKEQSKERYAQVVFDDVVAAMNKEQDFTENEFQIRQYFERMFLHLTRFNYYIEYKAIHPEELCSDFGYYAGLMGGEPSVRQAKLEHSKIDINPLVVAICKYNQRWRNIAVSNFLQVMKNTCYSK